MRDLTAAAAWGLWDRSQGAVRARPSVSYLLRCANGDVCTLPYEEEDNTVCKIGAHGYAALNFLTGHAAPSEVAQGPLRRKYARPRGCVGAVCGWV